VRLRRRDEVARHADVQRVVTDAEPDTAASGERRRLLDFLEPEALAVEPARDVFGSGRCGWS
jgi:hypothetical protein